MESGPERPILYLTPACAYTARLLDAILERHDCPWSIVRRLPSEDELTHSWKLIEMNCAGSSGAVCAPLAVPTCPPPPCYHWSSFVDVPWDAVLNGYISASHHYARRGLALKADFYHYVEKYCRRWSGSTKPTQSSVVRGSGDGGVVGPLTDGGTPSILSRAVPLTVPFDLEDIDDIDTMTSMVIDKGRRSCLEYSDHPFIGDSSLACACDARSLHGLWFVKSSSGNQAKGVILVSSIDELRAAASDLMKDDAKRRDSQPAAITTVVVQRHVPRPLLISSRKFHLRCHVVAIGHPVTVLLHTSAIVALVASGNYEKWLVSSRTSGKRSGGDFESDRQVHITNHCVQCEVRVLIG